MKNVLASFALLALLIAPSFSQSQSVGEFYSLRNLFTQPGVVPKGCLSVQPAFFNVPPSDILVFDSTFDVSDGQHSASVRIRSWRIGCHENGRSAIAVNFKLISGDPSINYPLASLIVPNSNTEENAGLFLFTLENVIQPQGLSTRPMTEEAFFDDGVTVVVDAPSLSLPVEVYNNDIFLRLQYGNGFIDIAIPEFDPLVDLRVTDQPRFNGRYSGQWTVDGLPNSGLVLQFAEQGTSAPPFVFLVWFTYRDGEPFWITGNTNLSSTTPSELTVDMFSLNGGEFVTQPGSYSADDTLVSEVGTMTIRPVDCNTIEADLDFSESGNGSQSLTFSRLIRIAGYDCDQTQ